MSEDKSQIPSLLYAQYSQGGGLCVNQRLCDTETQEHEYGQPTQSRLTFQRVHFMQ